MNSVFTKIRSKRSIIWFNEFVEIFSDRAHKELKEKLAAAGKLYIINMNI